MKTDSAFSLPIGCFLSCTLAFLHFRPSQSRQSEKWNRFDHSSRIAFIYARIRPTLTAFFSYEISILSNNGYSSSSGYGDNRRSRNRCCRITLPLARAMERTNLHNHL
uniref:Orf107 n=1 Tax=Batis maritima TaxID=4436 RepID=A0A068BD38_BATMA|nr:orf107 [Batis maritima]AIC83357.1 orf107 [Batis maritima]